MYNKKAFFGVIPKGSSLPLLELLRSYYFPCQLPFFAWTEEKSSLRPSQMCGEGWKKKHSKQPNSSFTVSIAKSPLGLPRNHPKAYEVNGRWQGRCSMFVSSAKLSEVSHLENYRATLKGIFYLYENSLVSRCRIVRKTLPVSVGLVTLHIILSRPTTLTKWTGILHKSRQLEVTKVGG
jgi:hypothetical protein